jgi:hypothetical protein
VKAALRDAVAVALLVGVGLALLAPVAPTTAAAVGVVAGLWAGLTVPRKYRGRRWR